MGIDARSGNTAAANDGVANPESSVQPQADVEFSLRDMFREVGAGMRAYTASATDQLARQRHEHTVGIMKLLKDGSIASSSMQEFAKDRLPDIRSQNELDRQMGELFTAGQAIIGRARALTENLITLIPAEQGGQKIQDAIDAIVERTRDASNEMRLQRDNFREEVFERERFDQRAEKIRKLEHTVVAELERTLERGELSADARAYVTQILAKRVSQALQAAKLDPINAPIDRKLCERFAEEPSKIRSFRIPAGAPGAGENVELPDSVRHSISSRFSGLPTRLERALEVPNSAYFLGSSNIFASANFDDQGRGAVTFSDHLTGALVKFQANESGMAHERVRAAQNVQQILEQFQQEGAVWDARAALRVFAQLTQQMRSGDGKEAFQIAELTPQNFSRRPEIRGFEIKTGPDSGPAAALDVLKGEYKLAYAQVGVSAEKAARLEFVLKERAFSIVSKGGAEGSGASPSCVVNIDLRAGGYGMSSQEAMKNAVELTTAALEKQQQLGSPARGGVGEVVKTLSALSHSRVTELSNVTLKAGDDVHLKLAPRADVRLVNVEKGATLALEGVGESREEFRLVGLRSAKGSTVEVRLEKANLADSTFNGVLAGQIKDSTFSNVRTPGGVRDYARADYGKIGEPITDSKCEFYGCAWKRDPVWSWANLKREWRLA